jgi:hypothetical protein
MSIWNSSPQRELTTNPLSGKLGADQFKQPLPLAKPDPHQFWNVLLSHAP